MVNVNFILLIFIETFSLTTSRCNLRGLISCNEVPIECLDCSLTIDCIYGRQISSSCRMLNGSSLDELTCTPNIACRRHQNSNRYKSNCTISDNTQLCLGSRTFYRNIECNWTSGNKKSNTLLLSIFLGGLGFDRIYLGHIKEAFGKIFSFGGLGIWTLIDSILIACGYLTPDDGSVYIE
ncbi:unnamed protein product [Adineta steineri]|uniref:TM2 domain-containing protein n=1 Tax=Adineta steineri TaxID=433720 RepID=A0A819JML5_9BILA|nr:unnamed protein product [Adineta steineri]CAF3933005.1 unnamed protein product [Adineta steineri]